MNSVQAVNSAFVAGPSLAGGTATTTQQIDSALVNVIKSGIVTAEIQPATVFSFTPLSLGLTTLGGSFLVTVQTETAETYCSALVFIDPGTEQVLQISQLLGQNLECVLGSSIGILNSGVVPVLAKIRCINLAF